MNQKFEAIPDATVIETSSSTFHGVDMSKSIRSVSKVLQKYGIDTEEPIACLLSPSAESVFSILGIWAAGGVYFPLDKQLPDDLLKKYLEVVQPGKLIIEPEHHERMQAILNAAFPTKIFEFIQDQETGLIFVTEINSFGVGNELSNPDPEPDSGNYILFTSGSTGIPKAIFGQHKSLSHFIHWEVNEFGLDSSERVSWLAPPMFDVSFRDILTPLLAGGTLVIPDEDVKKDARRLLAWLDAEEITTIHIVPSLFRLLTDELSLQSDQNPLPHLKRILLAGESLFESDVFRWQTVIGDQIELVNLYGPSETTLAKLFYRIGRIEASTDQIVPLGKPISNSAALILNNDKLCAIGERGEIHIKTPFLSKGYYGNPELTKTLFVQNPLAPDTNDIIYKSGDIGYYREDREIVFCGRLDHQLKIHGNRVEPSQIEAVIKSYDQIKHAVVIGKHSDEFSIQLVAFFEATSDIDISDLQRFISKRLPKYMCPDRLIRQAHMPFNRNGKIDRSALVDTLQEEASTGETPVGEIEDRLARLWSRLLHKDAIFRTADFFEMGGHSLLAIRMVSAIYREFTKEVSINDIFEFPLLKDLATFLEKVENREESKITPAPIMKKYPLSHAQRRLWTLESIQMDGGAMTITSAIRIRGKIDLHSYLKSWKKVVERHEILRTRIIVEHEKPRQVVHEDNFPVGYEVLDSDTSEVDILQRVDQVGKQQISMYDNWLFRITIFETKSLDYIVLLQMHHIIGDAWSLDIIAAEQKTIYELLVQKLPIEMENLPFHYKDYAYWQAKASDVDHLESAKKYWQEKLSDDLPVLSIPLDHARPVVKTYNGGIVLTVLDKKQSRNFEAICSRTHSTRFVTALTIFKLLLHRLSGQETVVVGTTIANRTQQGLDKQVGFYVQTLPLLDSLEEGLVFDDFIEAVNDTVKQAFKHSAYPFDLMVDDLRIQRNPARHPIFDAALVLHEDFPNDLIIAGTEVEEIPLTENLSLYDLQMTIRVIGNTIEIDLTYNSDLYLSNTAEQFLNVYTHLINELSDPYLAPANELLLIPRSEASYLLTRSSGRTELLPTEGLLTLIERSNGQFADKIAVEDSSHKWTYRYLHELAGGIAGKLLSKGLTAGDIVALHLDRSAFSIAALLGIWKAGGVYLPLYTDQPDVRKSTILDDSQCQFIISEEPLSLQNRVTTILVSECEHAESHSSASLSQEDRAYIIYTSGTTGNPKGVVVNNRGILNTVLEMVRSWEMSEQDKFLQFASLSFDASLAEILPALFVSATIMIPDDDTRQSPDQFRDFVREADISVALLTPAYLNALGNFDFSTLRLLISVGEAAKPADALKIQKQTRYCNAYGPSEASIQATAWFAEGAQHRSDLVPIGKPTANCEILILDQNQELLPLGFSGEICFSGPGIAEGYLNRPRLTAKYFVEHPFTADQIMYRTGDRGRINTSGDIEILGRIDDQVKVRGYRVEPGEIENILEKHDDVIRAFVTTKVINGHSDLIAYWSPQERPVLWPSVAEFYVYDEILYRAMYTDRARNDQYKAIFEKQLKEAIVLEIGPGPELILSRMALEAGASHVYAVELLEETYLRAKKRLEGLQLESRITLIHGDATKVSLPVKVDYCISEIVGGIGGSEGAALIINAVRDQLLDPTHMIPSRSRTMIAAADLDQNPLLKGFPDIAGHYVERIFEEQGYAFDLRLCIKDFPKASICSNNDDFEDLDYTTHVALEASHEIHLRFTRACLFTGFVVWLTLHIDESHQIDILETPESWLPVWLPVSIEGIKVSEGDVFTGSIQRTLSENGLNPDFSLTGTLKRQSATDVPIQLDSPHNKPLFKKSSFYKALFVQEVPRIIRSTSEAELKTFLSQQLPAYMIPAALIQVEKFPLTGRGKIDKNALSPPESIIEALDEDHSPRTDEEKSLAKIWCDVLGKQQLNLTDHFFKIGGDSIKAIQMVSRLQEIGYTIDMRNIFLYPILEEMSQNLKPMERSTGIGDSWGEVGLIPIQKWFFRTQNNCPEHFNQSVLLKLKSPTSGDQIRVSLQALVERHPMLRSRIITGESNRFDIPETGEDVVVSEVDLTSSAAEVEDLENRAEEIQKGFDLSAGPLFKSVIFHLSTGSYLLIVAHHLIIDGVSWRILLANLNTFNRHQLNGSGIDPLPSSLPFKEWSQTISEYAVSQTVQESAGKWRKMLQGNESSKGIDEPSLPDPMLRKDFIAINAELDADSTQFLIGEANHTYNTQINDLLITALVLAMGDLGLKRKVFIGMESTGREIPGRDINLSETIGWFTSYYILPLLMQKSGDIGYVIKDIKEQIRMIPDKGLSYGLLTERGDEDPLIPRIIPDVLFNYFGDISNTSEMETFSMLNWSIGPEISGQSEMASGLNFAAVVENNKLKITLFYHYEALDSGKAEGLIRKYLSYLSKIVSATRSAHKELTPSDLTATGMDMDDLDLFLDEIELDKQE
ncbi:MAG: amino acid adenylation domain-containing protein [Candidatus Marinimicrobia bacterium]|nr:amino acid adenylation domain-containing protein [Candidatus Neomarinimicrobiota bacterium]MBT4713712.1 amino acid adenylation domain-containing protein [Candidatus Neomarinimicrobiota bacterium]